MHLHNAAVRIRTSEVELLGKALTRAFYNDPCAKYIFPDAHARGALSSWFFASAIIRASRFSGEVYTTVNHDGGALWIPPGSEWTIEQAFRTEMPSLPFQFDRSSIKRWISVIRYFESVRRIVSDKLHWRLVALGTDPSKPGAVSRATLIDPILAKADSELRCCYVETFNDEDLLSYQEQGFQIAGAGQIPKGGPSFWSLVRPPRPYANKIPPMRGGLRILPGGGTAACSHG